MLKYLVGVFALVASSVTIAQDNPIFKIEKSVPAYSTFMEIHVIDEGKTVNERFFLGPLPEVGQAVEMVYVGSNSNGSMRFQLQVRK